MGNNHITKLEIDLNAIEYNFNYFKSKLLKETKILVVVKAFGYGSSSVAIAKFLESKVDYFAVAYLDEGIALRNAGIKTPILVLHPLKNNLKKIIEFNLETCIYSFNLFNDLIEELKSTDTKSYPIHIKFNTGLNRLGFKQDDVGDLVSIIKDNPAITVKSIFSHIAASEDLNESEFTHFQINTFKTISKEFSKKLGYLPINHMLNTSGIINYATEAQFNMVRLGIGLYGFGNNPNETKKLKNVLTLKSVISQIHNINKGETVGYNRAYKATSTIKTATIPIGHADGISRQQGNGVGYVYINKQKAYIIGNVCMDMIMVNVSDINCQEGDEVIVYKNQQHIEELAKGINTISYELITAISQRVNRVLKES